MPIDEGVFAGIVEQAMAGGLADEAILNQFGRDVLDMVQMQRAFMQSRSPVSLSTGEVESRGASLAEDEGNEGDI